MPLSSCHSPRKADHVEYAALQAALQASAADQMNADHAPPPSIQNQPAPASAPAAALARGTLVGCFGILQDRGNIV